MLLLLLVLSILCEASPGVEFSLLDLPGFAPCHLPPLPWRAAVVTKVLLEKWWRQMSHTWRHFLFVVPWVRFMQGRQVRCGGGGGGGCCVLGLLEGDRMPYSVAIFCFFFFSLSLSFLNSWQHTWYCGAYTLFNTHELAIVSGLAVAQRLGAEYPFDHDDLAATQFDKLMQVCVLRWVCLVRVGCVLRWVRVGCVLDVFGACLGVRVLCVWPLFCLCNPPPPSPFLPSRHRFHMV